MVKKAEWKGYVPLMQLLNSSPYPPFSPLFAADRDHSLPHPSFALSSPVVGSLGAVAPNVGVGGLVGPPKQPTSLQGVFTLDSVEAPVLQVPVLLPPASNSMVVSLFFSLCKVVCFFFF